jgi:hypothetical protein
MFTKRRILAILAAVALSIGIGLGTSGSAYAAQENGEIQVAADHSWCLTALNINKVGSEVVLGRCAGAQSQVFNTYWQITGSDGNIQTMIQSSYGAGLCITYDMPQGGQDGLYALLGNCVYAATQLFESTNTTGPWTWFDPNRQDSGGRTIAIDNAGGNLVVNNHIDESYYCPSCNSEKFVGLNY